MTISFVVEEAGCESCARLVRRALEPLGAVESVEVDEAADVSTVRLDSGATQDEVDRALADVSAGAGHAYRVRPGSWGTAQLSDVVYTTDVSGLRPADLDGFFVDWPTRPSAERHLEILRGSDHVVLARDGDGGRVVGFVTAISDGVLSAFIPLLEVLPEWQGQGIGSELVRRILAELDDFYMVDLVCDPELEPFYRRFELTVLAGMGRRRRHLLAG